METRKYKKIRNAFVTVTDFSMLDPKRRKSAAALSAAVDTTKQQETAPISQAEPSQQKPPTPNASRSSGEGVWGRGASLREAASPPEYLTRSFL